MLEELGHGAFGTVYLVRHKRLNTLRAVKCFRTDQGREKFLNEVNLLRNLKHSGIPTIYDVEEDDEGVYVIEEYVEGESLSNLVKKNGILSESKTCAIALKLCEVLIYLHNHGEGAIVHMDLKPENVYVCRDGSVKLLDFDNAALAYSRRNAYVGSVGFAAPEQYHRLETEPESDIYAFGMLILFMLTGGHDDPNVEQIKSRRLVKFIRKCTHHSLAMRFRCMEAVMAHLVKISGKIAVGSSHLSLQVNLLGMKPGIGTTHIALAITRYFSNKGFKSTYVDATENDGIRELAWRGRLKDTGAFFVSGIDVIPNFHGFVKIDDVWDVHVCDLGSVKREAKCYRDIHCNVECDEVRPDNVSGSKCNPWEISESATAADETIYVLVGGGKPWERGAFLEGLEYLSSLGNSCNGDVRLVCLMNHMGGRAFYSLAKDTKVMQWFGTVGDGGRKPVMYRMPCQFEWNGNSEDTVRIFDEMFADFVGDGKVSEALRLLRGICDDVKRIFREKYRRQ